MKRYSASELRQNLARAFDEVERGEPVVVERRGRRFRIVAEPVAKPRARIKPFFKLSDASLLAGGWTWTWGGPGRRMRLVARKGGRRS
jgi:antitoxin (DNA-binding transcriptional repressor) of toxin-antitoxin stability system